MSRAIVDRRSTPRSLHAVALIALFAMACTTVRVPASNVAATVPVRDSAAEPQIELWVESGKHVGHAEAQKAAAEAQAALRQALARRHVGDGEQMLVVRAQGVTRTGSRRANQQAAIAGLVVGAVAIVAVVVAVMVAGKGHGGGSAPKLAPARAGGATAARVARPAPVAAALPRVPAPALPAPRRVPAPGAPGHGLPRDGADRHLATVNADVQITVPLPTEDAPAADPGVEGSPEPFALGAPPQCPARDPGADVVLPPLAPLDVGTRGFFAGDSTRLELTLLDRATGRPLWVKVVHRGVDPRNARAVAALLDEALDDPRGWELVEPTLCPI